MVGCQVGRQKFDHIWVLITWIPADRKTQIFIMYTPTIYVLLKGFSLIQYASMMS